MNDEDKVTLGVSGGLCGCLLLAFVVIVFTLAAAVKWVIA